MSKKNKNDQPVTKEMLNEAVDAILEGVGHLVEKKIGETKQELHQEMQEGFRQTGECIEQLESRIKNIEAIINDEFDGLRSELSNTVTRKEFNELRRIVERYHPTY